MSETNDLNSAVIALINMRGGFAWRNNTGALRSNGRLVKFGRVGSGDVIGVYRGRFVSIETKTGRDVASKDQLKFAEAINACGGFAGFIRDVYDAVDFLDMVDAKIAEREGKQVIPF